jgi:hypothetical protein
MVRTNLQEFVGDVHVLSNLQVGSNLFANDLAANVLTIAGNVAAEYFIGDGGFLSNIATTLDDIISNPNGNSVSNTVVFISGQDPIANTAIVTYANVGISVSNTNPTGEYQLSIGSNIFVNTHASNVLTIIGSVGANTFIGDGGLLSNIATTLDAIIDQGNTVSNTIQLISGADVTSNTGLVTHKDVGISVSNTEPTGEFQFGVGSNLLVNVYSSNVLAIEGNVNAQKMTLGTITVTSAYGLNHVTAQGSVTGDTISLTNATTGLTADSNIVVGGNVTAETVITSANVEVGDRLKFASNVFVDDLRVADVAANLVTYDKTTGELMDSGGLFANKLAVVSVQPPSALSANTTTIAKHGTYTVTTSSLAANSNAWNAFDGDSSVEWLGSTTSDHVYNGGAGTYSGTSNLFAGNYIQTGVSSAGEWLAVEFPYKTTLRHMKLTPPTTYQQYPASANVYATNDSLTWTELTNWSDVNPGDQQSNVQTIIVNATESYKKYAMVVTKTNGSDTNTALAEWKLFTESFSIDGGKVEMASSAVMGGETTMDQHGPHSRGEAKLKKYPEIIFEEGKFDRNDSTNTYTQAGYTVSSSPVFDSSGTYTPWRAFDSVKDANRFWCSRNYAFDVNGDPSATISSFDPGNGAASVNAEYVTVTLPHKIKLSHLYLNSRPYSSRSNPPRDGYVYGSDNGTDWTLLKTYTDTGFNPNPTTTESKIINVDSTDSYNHFALLVSKIYYSGSSSRLYTTLTELELYGYEEGAGSQGDTSVDTTFTSIMNTPQTTGAQVYVDGNLGETLTNRVTGPDATGPSATYDETGKYWELNGSLESNIAVEANTFLSGDAPHSVSVWFNSSNLEANVSNTCVFSVSDQEKLDSQNLDLQSNTWHNLTYAYQGEGGSRVTYLDGRKVAEDQAEDTFGEYPPFAMTGNSQGGYVVSASSLRPSHQAWHAFDKTKYAAGVGEKWASEASQGDTFTGGNSLYDGTNRLSSSTPYGAWLKIELPHKIRLQYISLFSDPTTEQPKDFIIYGSNDDNTWDQLFQKTGATENADYVNYTINSVSCYKYFGLVIRRLISSTTIAAIDEWKLYGHRENDLVRLPDPTNVLKYPHIAMTGPAQRGYVVTASNEDTADTYYSWKAFDNGTGTISQVGWYTNENGNYNGANGTVTSTSTVRLAPETEKGDWLQLEFPYFFHLDYFVLYSQSDSPIVNTPDNFILYAKKNSSDTWTSLGTHTGTAAGQSAAGYTGTVDGSEVYKYFAIVVTKRFQQDPVGGFSIRELEFYGTEENSSIPIQIGGGNIDKVANFRVYDKFVGEDQALEIWDAQKDEFGRAKSSMTLQKGRLGIGTDEPQGRLAVLDEPHNLEEFPPRAMTDYKTYFEGHGEFCVYASTELIDANHEAWKSFNKFRGNDGWHTGGVNYTSGVYTAGKSLGGISGDYLVLKLPYKINLKSIAMVPRGGLPQRGPGSGVILGSNDEVIWEQVHSFSGITYTDNVYTTIDAISSTKTYNVFAMVVTNLAGTGVNTDYVNLAEWKLFGTREQGQSVLHDGQLTLTKSLTVPRIGPALDADDTPRRDRLVVEYNTSTNPTFEGAVRDTSGRGNDGVFVGTATYDATEKAFTFPGTADNYITRSQIGNSAGAWVHSFSMWVNTNDITYNHIFSIGVDGDDTTSTFRYDAGSGTDAFKWYFYGNDANFAYSGNLLNTWIHVVGVYDGGAVAGSRRLWVNGVESVQSSQSGTIEALTLPANTQLTLGERSNRAGIQTLNGSISNFKLYDTTLTAEEVKTLYDMGRCDEGHHVVNFSKTRVGIGLGDGEAPRGALDVRGDIHGGCPVYFGATSTAYRYASSTGTVIIFDSLIKSRGGGYDTSTGRFTVPLAGTYRFDFYARQHGTTAAYSRLRINGTAQQFGRCYYGAASVMVSLSAIHELNVGDIVDIIMQEDPTARITNQYNGFIGQYISSL